MELHKSVARTDHQLSVTRGRNWTTRSYSFQHFARRRNLRGRRDGRASRGGVAVFENVPDGNLVRQWVERTDPTNNGCAVPTGDQGCGLGGNAQCLGSSISIAADPSKSCNVTIATQFDIMRSDDCGQQTIICSRTIPPMEFCTLVPTADSTQSTWLFSHPPSTAVRPPSRRPSTATYLSIVGRAVTTVSQLICSTT